MQLQAIPPLSVVRQRMLAPRAVSLDNLNVSPQLLGAPLAQPLRRLWALLLDLLIVGLLSESSAVVLVAGLIWVAFNLRAKRAALTLPPRKLRVWLVIALIAALIAQNAWHNWQTDRITQTGASKTVVLSAGSAQHPPKSGSTAKKVIVDEVFDRLPPEGKIELLQAQLEEANEPKPASLKETVLHWADDLGMGFGWAIVYFSLVPVWLPGQTLGKKLLKIQVVALNGAPLTILTCFSRYGGYAAGAATGMFGFAQIYWDPNCQAVQDKIAHTVVVDLREANAPPSPLPDEPAQPPATAG